MGADRKFNFRSTKSQIHLDEFGITMGDIKSVALDFINQGFKDKKSKKENFKPLDKIKIVFSKIKDKDKIKKIQYFFIWVGIITFIGSLLQGENNEKGVSDKNKR